MTVFEIKKPEHTAKNGTANLQNTFTTKKYKSLLTSEKGAVWMPIINNAEKNLKKSTV